MTRSTLLYIFLILENIFSYIIVAKFGPQALAFTIPLFIINLFMSAYLFFGVLIATVMEDLDLHDNFIGLKCFKVKKKIYYKNFKHIFIAYKNENVYLFQDKLFYLASISKLKNVSEVDDKFKNKIQEKLDEYFFEKPTNETIEKKLQNWSGCLTKQDERDKKLEDIL